MHALSN